MTGHPVMVRLLTRGNLWFQLFYSGFNLCIPLSFILESRSNTGALFQLVKGLIIDELQQETEEQHLIVIMFIDSKIIGEQINVQI